MTLTFQSPVFFKNYITALIKKKKKRPPLYWLIGLEEENAVTVGAWG